MKLSRIIEIINPVLVRNFTDVDIKSLAYDSRNVTAETLFFAIHGEKYDGHKFIQDAIERGANSCVVEKEEKISTVPLIKVENVRETLAEISTHFYGFPSRKLLVVGITGTNGKTTTSFLIKNILDTAGRKAGLIGTMGCFIGDKNINLPNTTPESLWLQRIMREMVDSGIEVCIMEVSSHGIKMGRINNIDFDIGILTNISRDHLDFHRTFSDYVNTKLKLFQGLKEKSIAIVNLDDGESNRFIKGISTRCFTYGIKEEAHFKGEIKRIDENGMELLIRHKDKVFEISSPLRGRYNAYNIIPSFAFSYIIKVKEEEIKKGISSFQGVSGRGERVTTGLAFNCIIDYAHTPDALYNLFSSEKEMADGRLICVFGAGGDRDVGKRPEMGKVAASLCDVIILTSDNPRGEKPESIIKDILKGINSKKVTVEVNRRKAIETSINMAKRGDIVIIAGKGHERYQEIMGKRNSFNDREIAESCIRKLKEKN